MSRQEDKPRLWNGKRYLSLNYFLRQKFGHKVFKVALDAGFTCPNRDGTLSTEGCYFCSPNGSGDFAGSRDRDINEQFLQVRDMMHRKWPQARYIPYFQAFSNTYAPPDRLRRLYRQALSWDGVVGLAVATRPDCLEEEAMLVLEEVNQSNYLWVELGLQTIHKKSARLLNLGYDYDDFLKALQQLRKRQIDVCAHLILGLPGETRKEMIASASELASLPLQGIKLHLLHLIKDTPLSRLYEADDFPFLKQEEYVELIADIIEILPDTMVIHRLTGDGPREALLGPMWSLKKWEILNQIDRTLACRNTWQGRNHKKDKAILKK